MISPMKIRSTLAASGTLHVGGDIPLVKARTLTMTVRLTFNASATAGATMNAFYSPDGTDFDTETYATDNITVSAGNVVQKTIIIDPPEHGYIRLTVANSDSTYTITAIKVWYSIQSWELAGGVQKGDIRADTGEEDKTQMKRPGVPKHGT